MLSINQHNSYLISPLCLSLPWVDGVFGRQHWPLTSKATGRVEWLYVHKKKCKSDNKNICFLNSYLRTLKKIGN